MIITGAGGFAGRPKGRSSMKSAYMSNLFHALEAEDALTCLIGADDTI
jgi:D-erythronate 2-dehydrogenase